MRLDDWPERLSEYIESERLKPFSWSDNDCARFARGAHRAVSGESFLDQYKDTHKTQKQAYAYMRSIGCASIWDLIDKHLDRIPAQQAKRGDFVGHDGGDGLSLGICLGGLFACPSDCGLMFVDMREAITAWSLDNG